MRKKQAKSTKPEQAKAARVLRALRVPADCQLGVTDMAAESRLIVEPKTRTLHGTVGNEDE